MLSSGSKRFLALCCALCLLSLYLKIDPHEGFKPALLYWFFRPFLVVITSYMTIKSFSNFNRLELKEEGFSIPEFLGRTHFKWEQVSRFKIATQTQKSSERLQRFLLWCHIKVRTESISFRRLTTPYNRFSISNNYNIQGVDLVDLLNKYRDARLASLGLTEQNLKPAHGIPNPMSAGNAILIVFGILLPAFMIMLQIAYRHLYQ